MKNKILATLVAFGLVGSVSAIEINDNLSVNGFIDGSFNSLDAPTTASATQSSTTDTDNLGLDEVEVNFLLNVGSVAGELHIDNTTPAGTDKADIEQAHITYNFNENLSITFGKYGSSLGFEGEDPAGLFTYSRAYESGNFNFGNVDGQINGSNNVYEGIAFTYGADNYSVNLSLHESANANLDTEDLNVELSLSYTGIENLTIGGGYLFDNRDIASAESDVINVHAAYTVGKALIAAEYSKIDATTDLDAMMILIDYDVSDKLGVAVRYSSEEESTSVDVDKLTIAPNYAITESLGAILEYSDISHDTAGSDYDYLALELTYTF
jgi:hypothetical protein